MQMYLSLHKSEKADRVPAIHKDLSLANRLIGSLPAHDRALFLERSELVELKIHKVLTQAGQPAEHAYFPVDSFVSVILPVEDSPHLEVGLVGNEGMCNTSLVLGVNISSFTNLVQGTGRAFCIDRNTLQQQLHESSSLREVLMRYVSVRENHLAQQAACLNYHTVEQRLARWLLMTRDRTHSSEIFLTHEVLSLMLGARRESVSQAASTLQKRGLISYNRGYVMLLDEYQLETTACRCYKADLRVYHRILALQTVRI